MLHKKYFENKKEKISQIKISLIKFQIKPIFISSLFSLKIKNNPKSNIIITEEINLIEVLNNMIIRTNKLYQNFYNNKINIKLDNDQLSKRTKIINYIIDFIEVNINFKNSIKNKDTIFCEIIFLFDLLIIQNKNNKCLIPLEKLGLGALILLLKFNKIKEKVLSKKYKSIFENKYMSLKEINKIEVIALKLINYDIIQPNHIYYLDILYKFIFSPPFNNEKNNKNIYNQIISIIKNIMTFSNNYIKFHPFYFSSFIIKFYFVQNRIEKFQFKFDNYFEVNIEEYSELYDDFLKCFQKFINIEHFLIKNKEENFSKKILNKSLVYKKPIKFEKSDEKNINKFSTISASNGYCQRIDKKFSEKINNYCLNRKIKIGMSSMNNTYYTKFLDNYLFDDINNINRKTHHNILKTGRDIKNKNNIYLESPKKCGISINYRIKKKTENQIDNNEIKKNKNISIDSIFEKKIKINKKNEKEEFIKEYQSRKYKKLNSELADYSFYYKEKGNSIRKIYKSKNKEKKYSDYLLDNKITEIKNNQNFIKENVEKIKVNRLNILNNNAKQNRNIKESKINNNYYENDENDKNKSNIDESNLRNITNTIKQNIFSSKGNYYNNKEEFTKKLRKMNIRNFYKNKKSTNLKY